MGTRRDDFFDDDIGTTDTKTCPDVEEAIEVRSRQSDSEKEVNISPASRSPINEEIQDPITVSRAKLISEASDDGVKEENHYSDDYENSTSESTSSAQVNEPLEDSHRLNAELPCPIDSDNLSLQKSTEAPRSVEILIPKSESITTDQPAVQTNDHPNLNKPIEKQNTTELPSSKHVVIVPNEIIATKTPRFPLVKDLLNQPMQSALPIIGFCQPFSMTTRWDDIILAMPHHLMFMTNQNSVTVYPWQTVSDSTSTILDCFWCSFLYKLLVTTLEDNRIFIYDLASIVDYIKIRGQPLTVKHQSSQSQLSQSSVFLSNSSCTRPKTTANSKTRFTKSNQFGIYYCYIDDRHQSCMLTRIDHNTRKHIVSIDCTGGSSSTQVRVCALGVSQDKVSVALTNLIITFYDAENLMGLKQINLARLNYCHIRGVSALVYLWNTWLVFDPIEHQVVGLGKHQRQFTKILPEQPIQACPMDNGTLAIWLGYPGAVLYYHLNE